MWCGLVVSEVSIGMDGKSCFDVNCSRTTSSANAVTGVVYSREHVGLLSITLGI